jgi:hypothetical protein
MSNTSRTQAGGSASNIVDALVDAYNAHDAAGFAALFSTDAVTFEHPGRIAQVGRAGIERFYAERYAALPGLRTEVVHRIELGEYIVDHERVQRAPDQEPFDTVAINHVVDGEIRRLDIVRATAAAPSVGADVLDAVRVPLEQYIRGHATRDPAVMRAAFRPTAHIEGLRDGEFLSWDVDEYCRIMTGSPADDEASRVRVIDAIDVVGTIATARMTLHHGPVTFTDMFVLLLEHGTWLIANKVYHRHV